MVIRAYFHNKTEIDHSIKYLLLLKYLKKIISTVDNLPQKKLPVNIRRNLNSLAGSINIE